MRRLPWWAVAGLAAALGLRLWLIRDRWFDTDEMTHLHSALAILHGSVPYRDFFANHGPLFHPLLLPAAALAADPALALWAGRAAMLAFYLVLLAAQWRLPGPAAPVSERAYGLLYLLSFTTLSEKALEVRPDVPAAAAVSLLALAAASARPPGPFAAGAALGATLLVSLKAVFPGAGLVAALSRRGAAGGRASWPAKLAAGLAAAPAAAALYFAARGGLGDFLRDYGLVNLRMPRGFTAWEVLAPSLFENPVVWGLGLAGGAALGGNAAASWWLAASLAGIIASPSVYAQYLIFLGPPLAFFSARATRLWVEGRWGPRPAAALVSACLAASLAVSARALRIDNRLQLQRMACVSELTAPTDRVLDIWTGESFHRPHAAYFWYLPDDLVRVISGARLEDMLVAALEDPATKGLIWSETYMPALPPRALAAARARFRPSGCGRLHLRRAGA